MQDDNKMDTRRADEIINQIAHSRVVIETLHQLIETEVIFLSSGGKRWQPRLDDGRNRRIKHDKNSQMY
jgi:hypothetical protein